MSRLFLSREKVEFIGRLAVLFLGLIFITHELDLDIYFLLNHGRYVIENGIPTIEPFTIHEGFKFVMQQWLSAVIFWKAYSLAGAGGLVAIEYVVAAVLIASLYYLYVIMSEGNKQFSLLMASLVGVVICNLFICTRPQIFSTLILVWEIIVLELIVREKKHGLVLVLLVLSVLLINLHAAMWQMLIVSVLPYLAEVVYSSFTQKRLSDRQLLVILLAGISFIVIAGFINPYGVDAMTYVWRSYGVASINKLVGEMAPLSFTTILNKAVMALILATLATYYRKGTKLRYWLLTLGIMYLAGSAVRSIFLLLTIGIAPLAYVLRAVGAEKKHVEERAEGVSSGNLRLRIVTVIALVVVFLLVQCGDNEVTKYNLPIEARAVVLLIVGYLIASHAYSQRTGKTATQLCQSYSFMAIALLYVALLATQIVGYMASLGNYEPEAKRAAEYILEQPKGKDVKVWTNYNMGNYLEFQGIPCYMDTRAEVFLSANNKKKDVWQELALLELGKLTYQEFLARYDFDYIVTTQLDIMFFYLNNDSDYEKVLEYTREGYGLNGDTVVVRVFRPL